MIGGYELDVSARERVPRWINYGTPVFTVVAALVVSSVALVALGVNPVAAYGTMFLDTLTTPFGVTEVLLRSVPLVLTGLAVYLPLRAGLWNIGAEGQLFLGAIVGTWLGLTVGGPSVLVVPVMLAGAGVAGGLWGLVPGLLRARRGVNEIIVSLMLTFVGVEFAGFLVRGPMKGGQGNFPVSETLPAAAQLPTLGALVGGFERVHVGVLVAVLATVAIRYLLRSTRTGYEVTVTGANADAAEGSGIDVERVYVLVFVVGGVLAGTAGAIEIAGIQGRLRPNFSPGYGFTAIPIALLGRHGAVRVFLAGLFFAVLVVGGSSMELAFQVPAAIVEVIQALVILFLITAEFFKRYRISIERKQAAPGAAGSD
ncbi:MAG: ABC transporter permease [Haloarculaceae archaeon]